MSRSVEKGLLDSHQRADQGAASEPKFADRRKRLSHSGVRPSYQAASSSEAGAALSAGEISIARIPPRPSGAS
jgi:hypothetical protein